MASKDSANGGEKMGRSKRCNWFIRYCCCCCQCCCAEDDAHRPLLDSPTQKEVTPGPAATQGDTRAGEEGATQGDIGAGEETQEVELVVAETDESEGQKTPDVESDVEREKDQGQEQQKLVEVDLEPTMRARVESGTFVRGSSQRSSWRLVPSVTQQVKEAMAAEAKEKTESDVEGGKSQEGSAQVEQATELEELTFLGDDSEELVKDKPLRDVTLVAQDVEDEESTLEESVTMTFTIGSRGNQPMASNGDIKLNIVTSDGQQAGHGVELTSLAEEGGSSHDSFNAGTDQTTLPMTTNEN